MAFDWYNVGPKRGLQIFTFNKDPPPHPQSRYATEENYSNYTNADDIDIPIGLRSLFATVVIIHDASQRHRDDVKSAAFD